MKRAENVDGCCGRRRRDLARAAELCQDGRLSAGAHECALIALTVLQLQIPEAVFSAMDYHLDWLYASLQITARNDAVTVFSNSEGMSKAQQEDVDFLIAYDADDSCHVILIEAKGVTGWTNEQMTSKANRLRGIFGDDGTKWRGVVPHLVLVSSYFRKGSSPLSGHHGWLPLENWRG